MFVVIFVCVIALVSGQLASNSTSASPGVVAWINDDGSVASSSSPLKVTRISVGHYCVAGNNSNSPINSGFLPTFVTLQTNGRGSLFSVRGFLS